MTRPALIVGLGGTGQWVLTWLKRELLIMNNGQMPANVRLVAFDTQSQLNAGASRVGYQGRVDKAPVVGPTFLDDSEFIYLGGDSLELTQAVSEGQFKHIGSWYQAQKWLMNLARANFVLDEGAGRIRQFGRLAIFSDIMRGHADSKIRRAIETNLQSVRHFTAESKHLEMVLVGSFAGGTGSSMFIDIAILMRLIAKQLGINYILRGFFTLPSIYSRDPQKARSAETFAAWRELNRFMTVDPDFPLPKLDYLDGDEQFSMQLDRRLFDVCYLLGGNQNGQRLSEAPQQSVFPIISEAIQFILDEQAGNIDAQQILTGVAPAYGRSPETPLYSVIGAFTVQSPLNVTLKNFLTARELLLQLLAPSLKFDIENKPDAAQIHPLNMAMPDQNQEDSGHSGRQMRRQLLQNAMVFDDKGIKPTMFHSRIVYLVEAAVDGSQSPHIVDRLARSGIDLRVASESWGNVFLDFGGAPEFDAISRKVKEFTQYNLHKAYQRREGEKEDEARARFRKIRTDLNEKFGWMTVGGPSAFGDALNECQHAQIVIFRQVIRASLNNILNGHGEDFLRARRGKLGYAWDLIDGIVDDLDKFLALMDQVRNRREELRPELRIAEMSTRARRFLDQTTGKRLFWVFEHPSVKSAEEAYLEAAQREMELRREDLLLYYVTETAKAMRIVCQETLKAIEFWIRHLSVGDTSTGVTGILLSLTQQIQTFNTNSRVDGSIPNAKAFIGDIDLLKTDDIRKYLEAWRWNVTIDNERHGLRINVNILSDMEKLQELTDPGNFSTSRDQQTITSRNQAIILDMINKKGFMAQESSAIGNAIQQRYPPREFVHEFVDRKTGVLFNSHLGASPRLKSLFVRVKTFSNDPYFYGPDGVERELRNYYRLGQNERNESFLIEVVGSENPDKLTIMRSDHLLVNDDFQDWIECLNAYKRNIGEHNLVSSPNMLHIFSAEQQAANFEQRMFQNKENYRPLHPRIVTLLDNQVGLMQAIYLYLLGKIQEIKGDNEFPDLYRWELNLDGYLEGPHIWLTRGGFSSWEQPNIFNAIYSYVVVGHSHKPAHDDQIDYDAVENLLQTLKREDEIELILQGLSDDGIISKLRGIKRSLDAWSRHEHQDYIDLADVITFLLEERLNELLNRERQGGIRAFRQLWSSSIGQLGLSHENFDISAKEILRAACATWQVTLDEQAPPAIVGGIHIFKINASTIFKGLLIHPLIPVLFLQRDNLLPNDIDEIINIASQHWIEAERIVFVFLYATEDQLADTRQILREKVEEPYDYDVFVFNFRRLLDSFVSDNPQQALRSLILSGIHLKRATPFIITGPTPPGMFFGRKKELSDITSHAEVTSFAIVGGRRMGKTSILRRLHLELLPKAGFKTLYHDCAPTPDQTSFCRTLLGNDKWIPNSPFGQTITFGELLEAQTGAKKLVLLLDEVDELIVSDQRNSWALFKALRALVNSGGAQIVLSGERVLHESLKDPAGPLYNLANELLLGPLEKTFVDELISSPMKQLEIELVDKQKIIQMIYDFTSGHPNVVQRLCRRLIEQLSKQSAHRITLEDVNDVIENPKFISDDFLETYLSKASTLEHLIAILMAMNNQIGNLPDVYQALAENGINATYNQVHSALERLVDLRSILTRTPDRYSFNVSAFPLVVAKSKWSPSWIALRREIFIHVGDIAPEDAPPQYKGILW